MFRMRRRSVSLTAAVSVMLLAGSVSLAGAQRNADSVAVWTRDLRTGILRERADALAALTRDSVPTLPRATRDALVAELARMHASMLAEPRGGSTYHGELFADYYLKLVNAVAALRTRDASLALAPAVAVSDGVARRVARLGDAGVDAVVALLGRRYEVSAMLQTLGLAWFLADSTHAVLSERSRARIVLALIDAAASDSSDDMVGAAMGIESAGDPAFIPIATAMRDRVDTISAIGEISASSLDATVIPALTRIAATRSTAEIIGGAGRAMTASCVPRRSTATKAGQKRRETCASLARDFVPARVVRDERGGKARAGLDALRTRIELAFAAGSLTRGEHDMLAGNVAMVVRRLAP